MQKPSSKKPYFGPVRPVKTVSKAAIKFKNNRICYICGEQFNYQAEYEYEGVNGPKDARCVVFTNSDESNFLTKDHVIPKVLIKRYNLEGFRNQTVPCCFNCNNQKSKNEVDTYFRTVDKVFSNWR